MAMENIRTGREDRILTLYQVDPGFYNKIVSRRSSVSHRYSICQSPGKIPFIWEKQPGKPRDVPENKTLPPITLPPAVHSLNMPRPCVPPMGIKAYFLNKVKKLKMIKNVQLRLPPAIHDLNASRPKINTNRAKEYLWTNIKKVRKIKSINLGKKFRKGKPRKTKGDANAKNYPCYGTDKISDDLEFSISDVDYFTPTSASSGSSTSLSSSSSPYGINSKTLLRFFTIPKNILKRKLSKPETRSYSF